MLFDLVPTRPRRATSRVAGYKEVERDLRRHVEDALEATR